MNLWIPLLVVGVLALAGAAAVVHGRRRNARLQLRVLAGRRRLLGEEIDGRQAEVAEGAAISLRAAEVFLDRIHAGLVDREAHLQILQDLAALQRHKLVVLTRNRTAARTAAANAPAGSGTGEAPDQVDADGGGLVEQRERLEDRLLERIQQRSAAPPPPRGRRRRS